jgi:predicted aconitase with swiveling domain
MNRSGVIDGETLIEGSASAAALVLDEPLSFWGGVDSSTGTIIDGHHPQAGECVAGRVLVMPSGRGSSSSSSVLAEAIRFGVGPAAILLGQNDPIIVLGSLVAQQLYGARMPVALLDAGAYAACRDAGHIEVDARSERAAIKIS